MLHGVAPGHGLAHHVQGGQARALPEALRRVRVQTVVQQYLEHGLVERQRGDAQHVSHVGYGPVLEVFGNTTSVARSNQSNEALLLWRIGLWLAAWGAIIQLVPRHVRARDAAATCFNIFPQKLLIT